MAQQQVQLQAVLEVDHNAKSAAALQAQTIDLSQDGTTESIANEAGQKAGKDTLEIRQYQH